MMDRNKPEFLGRFDLVADLNRRRRIVADTHHGEAGRESVPLAHIGHIGRDLGLYRFGDLFSGKYSRGHKKKGNFTGTRRGLSVL